MSRAEKSGAVHHDRQLTRQIQPENIPEELRRRGQWVVWKLEKRDDKSTKVPYIAGGVVRASSTDLMTWCTFEEAVQALQGGRYHGIGFVFCSADPFVGVDLDDCRNPETGDIEEWAQEIIDNFTDVVLLEASPSGCGVHLITRGACKDGINTKSIEVYGQDRFFTVTGETL
jgi:primase-polymerase (primpol)-like protein